MTDKKNTNIVIIENSEEFSSWIETEIQNIENANIAGKADSVKSGHNLILETSPQIVILDLLLDDGSGMLILKKIRGLNLPIKIIVFTNYNFYKQECVKFGSDYFYDKSNEFEEMISTVKILCNNFNQIQG